MDKVMLAGIEVSKLCFGTLTLGPLQKNMTVEEGAELLAHAYSKGVNFFDTADSYDTYPYLREAIKKTNGDFVISTKSYAFDKEGAEKTVEKARRELDVDVIDIFMLHEQETRLTLEGHREALEFYLHEKALGRIRAVGVSTHAVEVVKSCAEMPEIDVIHPIVNISGLGLIDGNASQMLEAVSLAKHAGKGIFAMKPLGGGNLGKKYSECMEYVLNNENLDAIAVGMQTMEEIDMNVAVFEGEPVSQELRTACSKKDKVLNIADWCQACGLCLKSCQQRAIRISNGKLQVDRRKCITCGYCSRKCPLFALKIY